MRQTPEERFDRLGPPGEPDACWLWLGTRIGDMGYGGFKVGGVLVYAHRWAWERAHGPIPEGQKVLHTCDVPACVNHAHLFLGTQADNMADKVAKGRQAKGETHGSRTHPEAFKGATPTRPPKRPRRKPTTPPRWSPPALGVLRGEQVGNGKLTEEKVRALRAEVAGGASQEGVAGRYGVSQAAVSKIVRRLLWKHVT